MAKGTKSLDLGKLPYALVAKIDLAKFALGS